MLELGPRGLVWIALAVLLATVGALATVIAQSDQSSTEVRINARQLEDGRVEFALQQREGDGWGERILPDSRMFPANAQVDRWLSSSPVTLGAPGPDGAVLGAILESTDGWVAVDDTGRLGYRVEALRDDTPSYYLQSQLAIQIHGADGGYPGIWFMISCTDGVRTLEIQFVRSEPAHNRDYRYPFFLVDYIIYDTEEAAWGLDPFASRAVIGLVWRADDDDVGFGTKTVDIRRDTDLYLSIRDAYSLSIELVGSGTRDRFTVELEKAWDTPVVPNLDYCGSYSLRSLRDS